MENRKPVFSSSFVKKSSSKDSQQIIDKKNSTKRSIKKFR